MGGALTRKQVLGALGGGTVLLWLHACGGGDGGGDDGGGGVQCGASGSGIASNHGHVLTIAEADLSSATGRTYSIQGSASHDHTVTFSPAQLAALRAGQSVEVTSSMASSHSHMVTAHCV